MEFLYEDCKSLLEQVNLQEKELRHKRRWLIGLSTSRSESRKLKGSKFQTQRPIPEYLLREDDVYYETIKSFVEKLFGEYNSKSKTRILQDDMQLIHSPKDLTGLFSLINDMTNHGLLHFAEVLTGGSIKFEKTRWKMKQIIKRCLSEEFSKQKNTRLYENHSLILKNPHNFRWSNESRFIPDSRFYRAAARKILGILEDLPTQTLSAMHRKLRGIKGYVPKLIPKKSGWGRETLIKRLRKKCFGLLSKLSAGDSLQEPLAKAMDVAGLSLKLIQGCHYVTNFKQYSPEIIVLQNEIAMCIKLLDQRVKLSTLKDVKVLLDPKAKLTEKSLRTSIRNLLIEHLFECGDMDTVPQSLLEVLAIVKKGSNKHSAETKVEEEVECILSVSASIKQVIWDLIPERELDVEFSDVYMEDLEESDGDDICEDTDIELRENERNNVSQSTGEMEQDNFNSVEKTESVAEISLAESHSAAFSTREVFDAQRVLATRYHMVSLRNMEEMETGSLADVENQESMISSNFTYGERRSMFDDKSVCENRYLGIQDASDEVSMVAYRLIGRMLYDFAQTEGCELKSRDLSYLGVGSYDLKPKGAARKEPAHEKDGCSILIKAVEKLIPSSAKCEADRLKELMGSKVIRQ